MTEALPDPDCLTPITLTLREGRRVTLRAIREDDADGMQAAFRRLSKESRYMRFMSSMKELSPSLLDMAVHPVAGRDLALVALADSVDGATEGEVIGGARYIADAAREHCEFAIATSEEWRGTGLATTLMRQLIESARARGLKGMEGFILANNTAMRNLARRLGFETMASSEGPGVLRVWLDLRTGKQ